MPETECKFGNCKQSKTRTEIVEDAKGKIVQMLAKFLLETTISARYLTIVQNECRFLKLRHPRG